MILGTTITITEIATIDSSRSAVTLEIPVPLYPQLEAFLSESIVDKSMILGDLFVEDNFYDSDVLVDDIQMSYEWLGGVDTSDWI
ncbi:MAG: hypothetical protein XD93_0743 [candidate division WS6 bacterium 34_10]|uniref:Uncharacterized protein n=1 Tax=candidate division WS6 bacterium 34_10 TaxID=1641389 RepID=A0A101HHH7_9BACT|nr:MAG: hypothetical protein XD93_0743 [candidate division WS6 bacterium 34_10]